MSEKKKKKDLSEIGEFGLIRLLTEKITLKNKSSVLGVGDDAAVLGSGKEKMLVTSDILTEGIHFNLVYTPLKHLGYKAVVVNISDIYAMNAKPEQILVSIAISSKFTVEMVEEIYQGIHLACEKYHVDLVGGDTTSSLTGMTISITAIGSGSAGTLCYRSGAQKNDLLCVSGTLGAAYMGLQLLERERTIFETNQFTQPDLSGHEYIVGRQLKPEARGDIIDQLSKHEIIPTAMIDISDGLSSEILHITQASHKGSKIYTDKIPVAEGTKNMAAEMNMDHFTVASNGGEDYELLFTVPLVARDKIGMIPDITIIGYITDAEEGNHFILEDGSQMPICSLGWDGMKTS